VPSAPRSCNQLMKKVEKMNAVIKGTGYILAHVPDMVVHNGTTQTTELVVNPESEYLKKLPKALRSFEEVLEYWPNQVYIGNKTPEELAALTQDPKRGWVDLKCDVNSPYGKFGQIMPEEQFLLLMQACDVFDVVKLDGGFVKAYLESFKENPLIGEDILSRIPETGAELSEIERLVSEEHAEGLYLNEKLVGCVKRAHDIDINLSAHVMHENIVSKASSVLSILAAVSSSGIENDEVEYVIDCSEEACGDMNQRGGGNFAKAAAEIAGLNNASGSDTRGFCAGPAHAIVEAAALVKAGVYKTVMVTAGGCTAKLGMNAKNHIEKELPALEDCLGGFAVVITEDNGIDPIINLEMVGRHTVGTGAAPQNVIGSLVDAPLKKKGLRITDIDKFSPEMQNPDITKPAGAGDVPLANYKMIGALAVKNGEMERAELAEFPAKHGLMGWAPTQGHIPSGVPYIGFAREAMLSGAIKNAMIIGKGSLFLGRMTNLFDGVSFVIEANDGKSEETKGTVSEQEVKTMIASAMKDFALKLMEEL